jgi:hypothetical protein
MNSAAAASATKARSKVYSTRSWPCSSRMTFLGIFVSPRTALRPWTTGFRVPSVRSSCWEPASPGQPSRRAPAAPPPALGSIPAQLLPDSRFSRRASRQAGEARGDKTLSPPERPVEPSIMLPGVITKRPTNPLNHWNSSTSGRSSPSTGKVPFEGASLPLHPISAPAERRSDGLLALASRRSLRNPQPARRTGQPCQVGQAVPPALEPSRRYGQPCPRLFLLAAPTRSSHSRRPDWCIIDRVHGRRS